MTTDTKYTFFRYIYKQISWREIADFLYSFKELEMELDASIYYELIGFDFTQKDKHSRFTDLLFTKVIDRGEYFSWAIASSLDQLIASPQQLDKKMFDLRRLYEETIEKEHSLGCDFLDYFGGGYFYSFYRGYEVPWEKNYLEEIAQKYEPVRVIAQKISDGLKGGDIHIFKDGTYSIDSELEKELETLNRAVYPRLGWNN